MSGRGIYTTTIEWENIFRYTKHTIGDGPSIETPDGREDFR